MDEPIFMAGLTIHKPFTHQEVEVGFVIVTRDCEGGMVDVHDRRPVVLRPDDAWRWMKPETSLEEAARIMKRTPARIRQVSRRLGISFKANGKTGVVVKRKPKQKL